MAEAKGRKYWCDMLRALAILFVVGTHAIPSGTEAKIIYNQFAGPIMIPLFFAISGYVFPKRDCSWKKFGLSLFKKIIVPVIFLSFVWINLLKIPFAGVGQFAEFAAELVSGKKFWYVPAYLLAELCFFALQKIGKCFRITAVLAMVCFAIGQILAYADIGGYAMFNRALIAQIYLLVGNAFRRYEASGRKISVRAGIAAAAAWLMMVLLAMHFWPKQYIDVHLNRYYNLPYTLVLIVLGCAALLMLASKLEKVPRWLVLIGQNSFIIYMLHSRCFNKFNQMLDLIGFEAVKAVSWLYVPAKAVFAVAACLTMAIVFNRLVPFLVGRRYELRRKLII